MMKVVKVAGITICIRTEQLEELELLLDILGKTYAESVRLDFANKLITYEQANEKLDRMFARIAQASKLIHGGK